MGPIATTSNEAMLSDSMRRAQEGDRAAYALVLTHCRDVFDRLARERCPADNAEEVVRQCLLTVHRVRHTYDPGRSFSAWLEAIARHHGIGPALAPDSNARDRWRAWIDAHLRGLKPRQRVWLEP